MITPEERERSYDRYALYRENRARFELEMLRPFTIAFLFWLLGFIAICVFFNRIDWILTYIFVGIPIAVLIGAFIPMQSDGDMGKQSAGQRIKMSTVTLQDLDAVKGIDGVWVDGNHVKFEIPKEQANEVIDRINAEAKAKGLAIRISKEELKSDEEKDNKDESYGRLAHALKKKAEHDTVKNDQEEINMDKAKGTSTETGYVNKNNQRNNGKTDEPGTDNGQWFYEMECLICGHKYKANGSDIWQRKCPKCQGGKE